MNNIDAEKSVLGSVLLDYKVMGVLSTILSEDDFFDGCHRIIYQHMLELHKEGVPTDMVILSNALEESNNLKRIGGRTYLLDLVSFTPTALHAEEYAKEMIKASKKRDLSFIAEELKETSADTETEVDDILSAFKTKLLRLSDGRLEENRNIVSEYEEFKEEFKNLGEGDIMGMSTGLEMLDKATSGLIKNHIWVCGAYYGYGKTYFAINLINSVLEQDKRVLFFSLEMSANEIIQRLIALRARLSLTGVVGKVELQKVKPREEAEKFILEKIANGKLVIDDRARDADGVVSRMLTEENKEHVDFVALDYIQLLSGDDMYNTLRKATVLLQGATKEMNTTTLILSQVSNASQSDGKFSKTDGFKGAGDIGQIANVALKILRKKDEDTGEFSELYDLQITKMRHGRPGIIPHSIHFPGGKIIKRTKVEQAPAVERNMTDIFKGL